jgi:magnesium chelatase family protein
VFFLDEFPLFRTDVIEALRQPLESGDVTIARREESVTLPARGMVVLACNPCPWPHDEHDVFTVPESTAAVRRRVELARERQADRYRAESWRLNGQAPGPVLRDRWPLAPDAQRAVDTELYNGRLSRRGATRVHRLALTVADLRGLEAPGIDEVDIALRLRTGDPLMLATLERAG